MDIVFDLRASRSRACRFRFQHFDVVDAFGLAGVAIDMIGS